MGRIEEKAKIKQRKSLQKVILRSIGAAGMVGIAMVVPKVFEALYKLGLVPNLREKEYISSSASKLVKKGLVKFNGKYYCLTKEGEKTLRRWELADLKFKKPKRWDRRWRVIIFDIPEKMKATRNRITGLFRQAGFARLQDSVWVYPHECEDIVTLLKVDFGIGKYMLYLVVEEIENDKKLLEEFELV